MTQEVLLNVTQEGTGETVVLIHGFCGSSLYWKEVIPLLSKKFKVVAVDLRGHGKSRLGSRPFGIEEMADDVARLLDKMNIGQAFLFGHSLGGYVTLAFAEKYQDRLKGYGLIHSTPYPDSEEAKEGRNNSIELIAAKGMGPFIDGLIPKLFAPDSLAKMPEQVEFAKQIGLSTHPDGAIGCLEAMRDRKDRHFVIRGANTPSLLIAGEKDQIIPIEKIFSMDHPHMKMVELKGIGHMGMLEGPDILANELVKFIESL